MKNTGRALVVRDNQLLLMFRYYHGSVYFTIPGGKQDGNENIEQTTKREVMEETSIEIKLHERLSEVYDAEKDKTHHLFLAEYIQGVPKLGEDIEMKQMDEDPDNFYKPMWVNIEDIKNQVLIPSVLANTVRDYLISL